MTTYTYRASATNPDLNRGLPTYDTENLVSLLSTQLNLDLASVLPTTPVDTMSSQAARITPIMGILVQAETQITARRADETVSGLTHHEGFLDETGFDETALSGALNRKDWTQNDKARVSFDTPAAVVAVTTGTTAAPQPSVQQQQAAPVDFTILTHEISAFEDFLSYGQDTDLVLISLDEAEDAAATEVPTTAVAPLTLPSPQGTSLVNDVTAPLETEAILAYA